jgi:hypothetical protein
MSFNIKEKYNAPTKFDREPYGTIWQVFDENNYGLFYLQVSDSEDTPEWITYGTLLESAFDDSLYSDKFINEVLELYKIKKAIREN